MNTKKDLSFYWLQIIEQRDEESGRVERVSS